MYVLVAAPRGKDNPILPRRPEIIFSSEDRAKLVHEASDFIFDTGAEILDATSHFDTTFWSYTILIVPTAI